MGPQQVAGRVTIGKESITIVEKLERLKQGYKKLVEVEKGIVKLQDDLDQYANCIKIAKPDELQRFQVEREIIRDLLGQLLELQLDLTGGCMRLEQVITNEITAGFSLAFHEVEHAQALASAKANPSSVSYG